MKKIFFLSLILGSAYAAPQKIVCQAFSNSKSVSETFSAPIENGEATIYLSRPSYSTAFIKNAVVRYKLRDSSLLLSADAADGAAARKISTLIEGQIVSMGFGNQYGNSSDCGYPGNNCAPYGDTRGALTCYLE